MKAGIENLLVSGTLGQDNFYIQKQLLPENFKAACDEKGVSLTLNMQPGYDHSYYFIATFIEAHIAHHASFLKA